MRTRCEVPLRKKFVELHAGMPMARWLAAPMCSTISPTPSIWPSMRSARHDRAHAFRRPVKIRSPGCR